MAGAYMFQRWLSREATLIASFCLLVVLSFGGHGNACLSLSQSVCKSIMPRKVERRLKMSELAEAF